MIPLSWSREAQEDLAEIDRYYRPLDFAYAQRTIAAAVAAGDFLADYPRAGQLIDRTTLRKWSVPGSPYILLYRETQTELRIVRAVHTASNWQKFL